MIAAKVKMAIVRLALCGVIPFKFAEGLIGSLGLKGD